MSDVNQERVDEAAEVLQLIENKVCELESKVQGRDPGKGYIGTPPYFSRVNALVALYVGRVKKQS